MDLVVDQVQQLEDVDVGEILRMKEALNQILANATGQSIERIAIDTDRDFFMSGLQAKDYGLIDAVIERLPDTTEKL